jgi:hypothetical protein
MRYWLLAFGFQSALVLTDLPTCRLAVFDRH